MYKVTFLPDAERSFKKLDKPVQARIAEKIDWLAENADLIIHHPLTSLPDDLRGLCRIRIGDYRVLYWVYSEIRHIKIYDIEHRLPCTRISGKVRYAKRRGFDSEVFQSCLRLKKNTR